MSRSSEALERLQKQWSALVQAHPEEGQLAALGYPNIGYHTIQTVLDEWKVVLEAFDSNGTWQTSPDVALHDVPLALSLGALADLVKTGVSQGVRWLIESDFLSRLAQVTMQVSGLSARRVSIARNLAKAMAASSESAVRSVVEAETFARSLLEKQQRAHDAVAKLEERSDAAQQLEEHIDASRSAIEQLQALTQQFATQAEASLGAADQARKDAARAKGEIDALKDAAIKREEELKSRVGEANEAVSALQSEADEARKSVQTALRLARAQGLAKSFQDRSTILNSERRLWVLGFLGAGVVLLAVGITFVLEMPDLSYHSLVATLLKKAALIAPAIWVGWYCAKQSTKVGKVQEDYEYKAASALAYQSYKEEAAMSGDTTLSANLLQRAIETFGENPVRLYEDSKDEPSSPFSDLLSKVRQEKLADLLAEAMLKSLRK